jgi:uncharacterized protein YndB with AHSA1/START domain
MNVRTEIDFDVDRPPVAVFDYLADGENMPEWLGQFASAEKLTDGPVGLGTTYRFTMAQGESLLERLGSRRASDGDPPEAPTLELEWIDYDPPNRLEWNGSAVQRGPGTSVSPRGSFTLEATPEGGTRVHGLWVPEVTGLPRVAKPFFERAYRKDREEDCERLKAILGSAQGAAAEKASVAKPRLARRLVLFLTRW